MGGAEDALSVMKMLGGSRAMGPRVSALFGASPVVASASSSDASPVSAVSAAVAAVAETKTDASPWMTIESDSEYDSWEWDSDDDDGSGEEGDGGAAAKDDVAGSKAEHVGADDATLGDEDDVISVRKLSSLFRVPKTQAKALLARHRQSAAFGDDDDALSVRKLFTMLDAVPEAVAEAQNSASTEAAAETAQVEEQGEPCAGEHESSETKGAEVEEENDEAWTFAAAADPSGFVGMPIFVEGRGCCKVVDFSAGSFFSDAKHTLQFVAAEETEALTLWDGSNAGVRFRTLSKTEARAFWRRELREASKVR